MIRKLLLGPNGVALLAAASISAFPSGAALLSAATAALSASSALAGGKLKGKIVKAGDKGSIIRPVSGDDAFIVPSDAHGEVRLTGLEPGDFEIAPLLIPRSRWEKSRPKQMLRVGDDGQLAFAVREEKLRPDPRVRYAGPPVRRFVEAIPFDGVSGTIPVDAMVFDVRQSFAVLQPPPCDPLPGRPDTCNRTSWRNHIDVNASTAEEIIRLAPTTSAKAAAVIVAERTKNGAYKNLGDFAQRVCTKTRIDFDNASVRFGKTQILMKRGTDPKNPGFKCKPGKDGSNPEASLFWATFPFAGIGVWLATL